MFIEYINHFSFDIIDLDYARDTKGLTCSFLVHPAMLPCSSLKVRVFTSISFTRSTS